MTNAHKFPARARGWKRACLELAEQLTPVMKKSGELGRRIVPSNCYMYTVFMTQKGMVRFCDLESADCMLSLLLSLSMPSVNKSGHFCVSRVLLDRITKKRDCL